MRKKIEVSLIGLVAAAVTLVAAGVLVGNRFDLASLRPIRATKQIDFNSLNDVYGLLTRHFDGSVDQSKVLDYARAGVAAGAGDPYTVYLDAKSAKQLQNDLQGKLSGIGAEVGFKNSKLSIIAPLPGTPAEKAGVKAGDLIVAIDKEDPSGLSLDQAVDKIRGAKGTKVTLKLQRGNGLPFDVEITRDDIVVASVKWSMKENDIGYIQITRFNADTSDKITEAADDLKRQGAKKIILDMRNNPGGYLDAAVTVSSQFVGDGKMIVEERRADGKDTKKNPAESGGKLIGLPTVVLINGGSASASEITAGALQDQHAATIVGEKSFGKGSVQDIYNLPGGAQLKVTIAHWYTPNGKNISKEGIKPDVEVKLEQADYEAGRDPQLDKAIEILRQK